MAKKSPAKNETAYCLVSDTHFHAWTAFAYVDADGVNSRLRLTLEELRRATLIARDQHHTNLLVIAGDIFHVRGHLAPSVLNPVVDIFKELVQEGMRILMIPGNHDLETRESQRLSNAVTALENTGAKVIHGPVLSNEPQLAFVPWRSSPEHTFRDAQALRETIEKQGERVSDFDLIIHAPVDGVLPGIPSAGISAERLAALGYKRVFAGHYHNHRDFGNGVYSIGALCHQQWKDVGSKAGFLIVTPDEVRHYMSRSPLFVDVELELDEALTPDKITQIANNYVRIRSKVERDGDEEIQRHQMMAVGAKGVTVHPQPQAEVTRNTEAAYTGLTLEQSISRYIEQTEDADKLAVRELCFSILEQVRYAAAAKVKVPVAQARAQLELI